MPRIQHKRGTSANLASVNPTPLAGELVWDSTENAIKIGDGATAWSSLAYVTATPRSHVHDGGDITTGTIAYARLPVGSTTSTVCAGDDARLTDARTPTAHKASHATGGSDALTPGDIGAAPAASPTFTGTVTVPGLTSTSVILADDAATAGSVVYSFDGDLNTGIGRGGADVLTVVTSGSERVRVRADGNVGIGGAGGSNIGLYHQYTLASASTRYGELIYPTLASGGSSTVLVCASGGSMAASSSVTTLACFHASNVTLGAGAAVTNQYGVFVGAGFTGATNNYGIYSAIASGTGRWNFYADSTANNYFAGNVGIGSGTSSPTAALDINSDKIRLRTAKTPASASDTGNAGDICWDASYLYICTATNTWRRIAHSTW